MPKLKKYQKKLIKFIISPMPSRFPKNFYWGAATSAHQVEGGLKNNWTEWEKEHAKVESEFYKKGGKRSFNYPIGQVNVKEACTYENYISGKAADSFHRYKEDIQLLKELGLNAYRFSIDWSRIEPEKGKYSKEGIEYYKNLIRELKGNGIEPFLTCWHWPIPLWLEEEGGLLSKNIVEYFGKYIEVLVENFGQDVKYWMTINEPLVVSTSSYLQGKRPPQKKNIFKFWKVCFVNLVDMHKRGYEVIKEYDPDLQVAISKNFLGVGGEGYNFLQRIIKKIFGCFWNDLFLHKIEGYLDFIGLNYYAEAEIDIFNFKKEEKRRSDIGWRLRPYSIYYVLKDLKEKYNLPIIITENGLADREDKYRKWWLDETFRAMEDALKDGVDLFGYLHWSLLDNFEWSEGHWPKFGLVEVDRETCERRIRESGYYYRDLVKKHS
jgi:beta-glucosidase